MPNCPYCERDVKDGDSFCPSCGKALAGNDASGAAAAPSGETGKEPTVVVFPQKRPGGTVNPPPAPQNTPPQGPPKKDMNMPVVVVLAVLLLLVLALIVGFLLVQRNLMAQIGAELSQAASLASKIIRQP